LKPFIVFLLLILTAAGGLFFYLLRFDPEKIRPMLEHELSRSLGAEVDTKGIRFLSRMRREIEIQGISVMPRSGGTAFIRIPAALFKIQSGPLFRKELAISLITIGEAKIEFSKQSGGWNADVNPSPGESGTLQQDTVSPTPPLYFWQPGPWKLRIHAVDLRSAELLLADRTTVRPFEALVHSIDGLLTKTETEHLYQFQIQGEAPWLPDPDIIFQGVFDTGKRVLLLTGSAGEQEWMFEGALDLSGALLQTQGELAIFRYALNNDLLKASFTAEIQGIVEGSNPGEWFTSLAAKGAVDLRAGAFKPANLIREALQASLEVMAGEEGAAQDWDTTGLKSLESEESVFDLAQANIEIFHERIFIREGLLKHEDYLMEMEGSYDMARREADFKAKLVFLENASASLVERHPILGNLLNEHGRLVIPLRYTGLLPHGVVKPDADYLKMRTLASSSPAANANGPAAAPS